MTAVTTVGVYCAWCVAAIGIGDAMAKWQDERGEVTDTVRSVDDALAALVRDRRLVDRDMRPLALYAVTQVTATPACARHAAGALMQP